MCALDVEVIVPLAMSPSVGPESASAAEWAQVGWPSERPEALAVGDVSCPAFFPYALRRVAR